MKACRVVASPEAHRWALVAALANLTLGSEHFREASFIDKANARKDLARVAMAVKATATKDMLTLPRLLSEVWGSPKP